jgi:hypothetical protein
MPSLRRRHPCEYVAALRTLTPYPERFIGSSPALATIVVRHPATVVAQAITPTAPDPDTSSLARDRLTIRDGDALPAVEQTAR